MKKFIKSLLIISAIILLVIFVLPFAIPSPKSENAKPAEALKDPDSKFVEIDSIMVHYKESGENEPALILLHGFGASVFSWKEVVPLLAEANRVIAYDRPAFGLTERKLAGDWAGKNPYSLESQPELLIHMLDSLGIKKAILVGHSAGGTVAIKTALEYPQYIEKLILVNPAVYSSGGVPGWVKPILLSPQMDRIGPYISHYFISRSDALIKRAWYDPTKITTEVYEGYQRPLQIKNWDFALWELTKTYTNPDLVSKLNLLSMPVLIIAGDGDRVIPPEQTIRLADDFPQSSLLVIQNCGHVPQEECPGAFIDVVKFFLQSK